MWRVWYGHTQVRGKWKEKKNASLRPTVQQITGAIIAHWYSYL